MSISNEEDDEIMTFNWHQSTRACLSAGAAIAIILIGADMAEATDNKNTVHTLQKVKPTTPTPEQEANAKPRMPMLNDVCDFPGELPPEIAAQCKEKKARGPRQ